VTTVISGLLLIALVVTPGYIAVLALWPRPAGRWPALELAVISLAAGALVTGWLALLLAEVGWLHLPLLALLVGLASVTLALVARRRRRPLHPGPLAWAPADTALVAVALVALALFARPHETVLGGTDAGVYANTGASIARTGRLLIDDPVTASLAPSARLPRAETDTPDTAPAGVDGAIRHLMLRLPVGRFPFADYLRLAGFYVLDVTTGTLTPQFLHLYPAWLGLFGRALGTDGLLFATPALAWLGVLMVGLLGRLLFGPWVGAVAALILTANGLQIWFARHSLSEALLQFLLCAAAFGWAAAHAPPTSAPASRPARPAVGPLLLAGTALGSLALAHAQFTFAYALLPPLAIWLWLARRWHAAYWAFFGPIVLLSLHATVHILLFALGYFEGLYHHVILDGWDARTLLVPLVAAGALGLALLNWQRDRWWPLVTQPRLRQPAPLVLATAVGLTLAYVYILRPGVIAPAALANPTDLAGYIGAPVPRGPEANLVRLGWYLSPLGILLAGAGAVGIVRRVDIRTVLLLGLTLVYGLAFSLASFTHESYIYSLRRLVPLVLPFACLAAAYAIVVMIPGFVMWRSRTAARRRLGWAAATTALGALLLFFVATGRTIASHVEYDGARQQIAAIAAQFAPNDIILFAGQRDEPHKLATPLRFLHGLDALVVSTNNPRGDLIEDWLDQQQQAGRRIRLALGNNGGKLLLPNYRLEPIGTIGLTLRELERLADQKPYNIQTNSLEYTVYALHRATGAPLPAPPYRYQTGPGDEAATVIGWYGREVDPTGLAYRWTNGDAMLRVPWLANRAPQRLRLHIAGGTRPAHLGPASVDVSLARGQNDRAAVHLGTVSAGEGFSTVELTVPADALPDQPTGQAIVWLRNPAWQPSEHGLSADARPLGVRLAWLELSP
jgi:hypothetical protein